MACLSLQGPSEALTDFDFAFVLTMTAHRCLCLVNFKSCGLMAVRFAMGVTVALHHC